MFPTSPSPTHLTGACASTQAAEQAAPKDGDEEMAAADAGAPLSFTDVQREAAAKQRVYEASTAGPSGRAHTGGDAAGMPALWSRATVHVS